MAFKVNDYLKNVKKSGLYLVKDLTKDYLPGSDKIVNSISSSLSGIRKSSQGSYVKNVAGIIKNSSYFNTVHKGILQSFDGLKTGNIYMDDDARLEAQMSASGMGLNFDLDFDDGMDVSDSEKAAYNSLEDSKREETFRDRVANLSNTKASGVTAGDKMVARSTIESAQVASLAQIETLRTLHADNRAFMAKFSGDVTNGITAMNSAIVSIAEFNNTVHKQFIELSTNYYTENNNILSEMVGILKTEREERIKAMQDDSDRKVSSSQNYVDHIAKGNYGSAGRDIGGRFMRAMDNTYLDGMWGLMGGFLPMMLGQIFADPIGGAIKWGAKSLINKKFKLGSLDGGLDLNQAFASVLSGAATKLSRSESDLLKNFAYEMTVRTSEMKSTPDLGVSMKSLGWNSLAQESLVTVIPTYLRKILAAVSSEEEIVYNYNTGKMRTRDEIAAEYASSAPNLSNEVTGLTRSIIDYDKGQKDSYFQDMSPKVLHNVMADILEEFVDKGKNIRDIVSTSFEELVNMLPNITKDHGWSKDNHAALRILLREMDSDPSAALGYDLINRDVGRFQSKVIAHWNNLLKGSKLTGASSLFDRSNIVDPTASSIKMSSMISRLADPNMSTEEKMKLQKAMAKGLLDDNGEIKKGGKVSRSIDRISLDEIYADITSARTKGTDYDNWKSINPNKATIDPKDAEYIAKALDQETLSAAFIERLMPMLKMLKNTKLGESDEFVKLMKTQLYDKDKIIETKGEWTKMYTKEVYKLLRNLPEVKNMFGEYKEDELEGDSDSVDIKGNKKSNLEVRMEGLLRHLGVESPAEAEARVKKLQQEHAEMSAERKEAFAKIDNDDMLTDEEKKEKKLEITKGKFSELVSNSSLGKFVKEKIDSAVKWKDQNMPNAGKYAMAATGGILGVGVLGKILGGLSGLGSVTSSFGITSPMFLASLGLAAGIWAGKKSLEGNLFGSFTDVQKDNFMKRTLPSVLGGAGVFAVMNRLGASMLPFGGVLAPILAASAGLGFSVMSHENDLFRNLFGKLPMNGEGKIDWKPVMKNGLWGVLGAGIGAAGIKMAGGLPVFGNIISGISGSMGLLSPIAMATTAVGLGLLANTKTATKVFFGDEGENKSFHILMKEWLFGNAAENKKGLFTKYTDRLINWGKKGKDTFMAYMANNIMEPIKAAMDPAKDLFKNAIFSMKESFNKMTVNMRDDFGNIVSVPFSKMIETKIVEPFSKFLDKTTSWAAGFLGKLFSAPIKFVSNMITKTRDRIADRNGGFMPFQRGTSNEYGSGAPTDLSYANSNLSWTDKMFGTSGYGTGIGGVDKDSKEAGKHRQQDGSFYFSQKNREWSDAKFKDGSTLGEQGCGVAAAAMAISIIHDRMVSPDMLMPLAHNFKSPKGGIQPSFFVKAAEAFSLHADGYRRKHVSIVDIENLVRAGNVVIACIVKEAADGIMYKHYIVIHGVTGGRWKVLDPENKDIKVMEPMQVMGYLDSATIIYKDGATKFKKRNITRMNAQLQERDGSELNDGIGGKALGLLGKLGKKTAELFRSPFGALGVPLQMLGIRNPLTMLFGNKPEDLLKSQNDNMNSSIQSQEQRLKDEVENKKGKANIGIDLGGKQGQLTVAKAIIDMKTIMHKDDMRIVHSLDKIYREISYSLNGVSYNLEYIKRLLASNLDDLSDADKPNTSLLRNKKFKAAKGTVKNFVDRYVMGPMSTVKTFLSDIHTGISMYIGDAITGTKKIFGKAMEVFNPLVKGSKWILGLPFKFLGAINDIALTMGKGLMKIGSKVLDIATVTVSEAIKFSMDIFAGGVKGLFGSVKIMFDKGIDMFTNLGGSLEGLITGIGTGIGNIFKGLMTGLGGLVGGTFRGIGSGIAAIGSIAKGTFSFADWFHKINTDIQKVHVVGGTLDKVTSVNTVGSVAAVDMTHYNEVMNKLKATNTEGAKEAAMVTKAAEAREVDKRQDTAAPEQAKQTEALNKIASAVSREDGKTLSTIKNQTKASGGSIGDNISNWIQSFLPMIIPGVVGATVSYFTLKNAKNMILGEDNVIDNNVMREGDATSMKRNFVRHGVTFGVKHGVNAAKNLGGGVYNFTKGIFKGAKYTGAQANKLWQWSLNKTTEATVNTVKDTAASPDKTRKLITKIGGALVNFISKIFTNEKVIGLIGEDFCAKILTKLSKFGDDFIAVAIKSSKGKIKNGALRSLAILPVIDAFLAIWSFFQGYNNASDFLDVHEEDCTTGMRVVAGLSEAIITGVGSKMPGLSLILGLLPPSWYMSSLYKLVVSEENEKELDIKQAKFKEDIEKAEKEALAKGEEFSYRKYRDEQKKNHKIKNTFRLADLAETPDYAKNRPANAPKPFIPGTGYTSNPMQNQFQRGGFGDFVSQTDSAFSSLDMSLAGEGATFGNAGCGPSTLAMAMSDLGINPNIPSLAQAAVGYRQDPTKGVSMNYLHDGLNGIGANNSAVHYNNTDDIMSNLARGGKSILLSKTSSGNPHYVYAKGLDNNGNVIMADPLSNGIKSISPNSKLMRDAKAGIDIGGFGDGVEAKQTETPKTENNSFLSSMANMTSGVADLAAQMIYSLSGGALDLSFIRDKLGGIFGGGVDGEGGASQLAPGETEATLQEHIAKLGKHGLRMTTDSTKSLIDRAATWVTAHEGFRDEAYVDNGKGYSIGHGLFLQKMDGTWSLPAGVTVEQAQKWMKNGITKAESETVVKRHLVHLDTLLSNNTTWYSKLSPNRKIAMLNMAYNLGPHGLMNRAEKPSANWPKLTGLLDKGKFDEVHNEILGTVYHKQVGKRAMDVITMLQKDAAGPFDGIVNSLKKSVRGQVNNFVKTSVNKGTNWLSTGVRNAMNVPTKYVNGQINKGITSGVKASEGLFGKLASWGGRQVGNFYNWLGGKTGVNTNTGNPFLTMINEMLGGFFPGFNGGSANYSNKDYYAGFWNPRPGDKTGGNYLGSILTNKRPDINPNNNKYWDTLFGNGGFGPFDGILKSLGNSLKGQANSFIKSSVNKGTNWLSTGVRNAMNVPTKHASLYANQAITKGMKASEGLFGKIANWGGRQAGKVYNWFGGKTGVNTNTGNPLLDMLNEMIGGFFPGFNKGAAKYGDTNWFNGFWNARPADKTGGNYLGNILTNKRPDINPNNTKYWNSMFGNGDFGVGETSKKIAETNKALANARTLNEVRAMRAQLKEGNELKESIKNMRAEAAGESINYSADTDLSRRTSDDKYKETKTIDNSEVIAAINEQTKVISALLSTLISNGLNPIVVPAGGGGTNNFNLSGGDNGSNFLEQIFNISRGGA